MKGTAYAVIDVTAPPSNSHSTRHRRQRARLVIRLEVRRRRRRVARRAVGPCIEIGCAAGGATFDRQAVSRDRSTLAKRASAPRSRSRSGGPTSSSSRAGRATARDHFPDLIGTLAVGKSKPWASGSRPDGPDLQSGRLRRVRRRIIPSALRARLRPVRHDRRRRRLSTRALDPSLEKQLGRHVSASPARMAIDWGFGRNRGLGVTDPHLTS